MESAFSRNMSKLRKEHGLSQRKAAADLHISQALLSHYENGAREPGLPFLCRACDYYGVTADYLLGRDSEAVEDDEPDLRMIARAGRKMTPAQRENLLRYAQFMFPEAFQEDDA